jgi:adenosyl cobinamide kinase/adenosyl cobinamide phosphate guanylyltransferase
VLTLVLGGTRSGKSEVAESLAVTGAGAVTYVATGAASDDDMAARIAAHRARRSANWATVEAGTDLPAVLTAVEGTALVDSLGTWVAGHPDLEVDRAGLCRALAARQGDTIVVSEEVGLGVHATTALGRRFADVLGELNRAVAALADRVLLVVAGRVLPLARLDGAAERPGPASFRGPGDAVGERASYARDLDLPNG